MDEPRITYPCDYPIKVVCDTNETFLEQVLALGIKHDPLLTSDKVSQRASSGGRYTSVTLMLTAQGPEQIEQLFQDLKALEFVRLVL